MLIVHCNIIQNYTDVLREYLDYQVFMVQLTRAHAVDTMPFLLCKEGPGNEAACRHAALGKYKLMKSKIVVNYELIKYY